MKIFLIDDEKILSDGIKRKLTQYGYSTDIFTSYSHLINHQNDTYCDLYIVDISLPDKDGFAIINYLRNNLWLNTPIIVLSWYQWVEYKVQALNLWADDYITKPFSPDELIARIRSVLRRKSSWSIVSLLRYKDISLNITSGEVVKKWERIRLTKKEKQLLEFFMFNTWRLIKKTELIRSVWKQNNENKNRENTLWVTLFNMRQKLGEDFSLETRVGEWYILVD
jgi:DNA-binding response OmpR family regulator